MDQIPESKNAKVRIDDHGKSSEQTIAADNASGKISESSVGDPWLKFLDPENSSEFLSGWLAISCTKIDRVEAGILFIRGDGNRIGVAASWRVNEKDTSEFEKIAEQIARTPEPFVQPLKHRALVGYPVELGGVVQAIYVLMLSRHPGSNLRKLFRELHWATGWIESQLWRGKSALSTKQVASAQLTLELLSAADQHERFDASAMATVNAILELTGFERAALGMIKRKRVRFEALSRAASFKRKANFIADVEAAMDEAVAQGDVIALPAAQNDRNKIDMAHRRLADQLGSGAIITAPLIVRGKPVGALLLEKVRGKEEVISIDPDAVEELRLAAASIAPVLKLKYDERRWWSGRARTVLGRALSAVFGRRPAIMLGAIAAVILIAIPFFLSVDMRISGKATLQGRQQRVAVALQDGFVRSSNIRAGDNVKKGALLAKLDDRDLRLQLSQNQAQLAQARQAVRDALAKGDRAASAKASADIQNAQSALDLTNIEMQRLAVSAPVSGLVVSGDLSQKLGAPVSKGDILFEIARIDEFRVIVKINEYDLADIYPGQAGELLLTSLSSLKVAIIVTGISSVSDPVGGENSFLVEASVENLPIEARPGMEGVAKIVVGKNSLAWVWGRSTINRLRILLWRFWP